ncbi:hypothetical protein DL89DRAFT_154507 [Linderina pennispora]|uniref:Protein kinase domain-containing protein n=1 Tax=Linderina pennispora TaxID=61395 RepID=A0A1Y1W9W9_9FUNG|nr:uncharacterized protein DL89DRAFT_154507 [Linderina pennispora]ORX70242.1 hypothetical protein DL89DRAFT_154507 [Linderina pennispora]
MAHSSYYSSDTAVPPAKNAGSSAGIESDEQTIWWDNKYEELAEADYWVKERLIRDADAVFDIVEPRIATTRRLARLVSAQVALELEHRLNTVDSSAASSVDDIQDALRELACDIGTCQQQQQQEQQQALFDIAGYSRAKDESRESTDSSFASLEQWIRPTPATPTDSANGNSTRTAEQILKSAMSLILFVSRHTDTFVRALDTDTFGRHLEDYRHILPCVSSDRECSDAAECLASEAGIKTQGPHSSIELVSGFSYSDALALIVARSDKTRRTVDKAYAQLMQSTRNIYKCHHFRRFAWGLTVCDNEVRVCLLSNDAVFSSSVLDITAAAGRRQFVELLVNFALCEEDQLGSDPSIYWDAEANCWAIDCPDTADMASRPVATKTYYFDKVLLGADGLFGRHTRCYLVTDEEPTGGGITPKFVIKDAWPEAEEDRVDDKRDEVSLLHRITTELAQSDVEDLVYPRLDAGGRVYIGTGRGMFEDQSSHILGSLFSLHKPDGTAIPFRAHKRLAMSPIGDSLDTVESVDEFIVVLGDAMRCHSEVVSRCSILHRDISSNNILVVREEGKPARGLLIDFDCALDLSDSRGPNLETRGTIPFMSINNLLRSDVERSALDDWESLIYLICWHGTIGICREKADRRSLEELEDLEVGRWRSGAAREAGEVKENHMFSSTILDNKILDHFHFVEDVGILKDLTEDLYKALFQNPNLRKDARCDGSRYKGTMPVRIRGVKEKPDPFKERLTKKSEIAAALLETMTQAWRTSKSKL